MIYKNGEEYINLSDFKLTRISDIYNNLDNNKQPIFLDEKGDKIKVNKISKEPYSGKIYDVTVPNHIILVKKRSLARMGKGKRGLKYILVLHHNGAKTRGIKNGKRRN